MEQSQGRMEEMHLRRCRCTTGTDTLVEELCSGEGETRQLKKGARLGEF